MASFNSDTAHAYNGYTKDLDAETQRKNEIESIVKLLKQNPNNPYWQSRYNELVIKPIYGEEWEQDADRLRELLASDIHPVDEAYRLETNAKCVLCDKGKTIIDCYEHRGGFITEKITCPCCNGNFENCPNCKDATVSVADDIRADMRGHL